MKSEELMKEACGKVGCEENMFCFGGKQGILCREAILECTKIRTKQIEHDAWQLLEKAKGEPYLGHKNNELEK